MARKLLLVTIASQKIGLGHLSRCLTLASVATGCGWEPKFLGFGDELAFAAVVLQGFSCQVFSMFELTNGFACEAADAAIVDVAYPTLFADGVPVDGVMRAIREAIPVVMAIDSLGSDSLAARTPHVPLSGLFVPYAVGEDDRRRLAKVAAQTFAGPDYAVLGSAYGGASSRVVREVADRVLVTCGGSDPRAWTPIVMRALDLVGGQLSVRVIVGPLFADALRAEISALVAASAHNVDVIEAPENLAEHMAWCDLAIAASGLTKYELAATGTPTLLFSIDAHHEVSNAAFAALEVMRNLGAAPAISHLASEAAAMLADPALRLKLSRAAQEVVDGRGAHRVVSSILEGSSCFGKH